MRPPRRADSEASAETAIVQLPRPTTSFRLLIAAKGLPQPPDGTAYAVWLYTSADEKLFIGFPKATVNDKGTLDVVADLTPQTPRYADVLLTRERVEQPKKPGQIVLRGALEVPQQPAGQTPTQTQTQTQPAP